MAVLGGGQGTSVLRVEAGPGGTVLSLGRDVAFHVTQSRVQNAKGLRVGDTAMVAAWTEVRGRSRTPYYAISLDGAEVQRVTQASYLIEAQAGRFDPLSQAAPVHPRLRAREGNETYIVQFLTQPLEEYRNEIGRLGGSIYSYFPNHAFVIGMRPEVRDRIAALPYVRAVVPFHPGFKTDAELRSRFLSGTLAKDRYNVSVFVPGMEQKQTVADLIRMLGGTVENMSGQDHLMVATLSADQFRSVLDISEVAFVDRKGEPSDDMDNVRVVTGANMIETTYGFTGQGVRAEVMDGNVRQTHQAFLPRGITLHGGVTGSTSHGTSTTGIVFGDGSGNAAGRGMLPDGAIMFASYSVVSNRPLHTSQLLGSPYFCVFQSNSWGNPQVTTYTTVSQQMDQMLFDNDVAIFQSQSNTGNQLSRPEAWAKNIVSVGGISHFNTATRADDAWTSASIGPAADGRLKPDISFWYDSILCPTDTSDTAYTTGFGGTSAATPMSAGVAGIFYQMWFRGFFGNCVTAATVFDARPKASVTKAMLVNTAYRYAFAGAAANLSRYKQGFGTPDLGNMNSARDKAFIINESDVISNLQTITYRLWVPPGESEFRATMVYTDPPGIVGAAVARINNLSLRVTSPGGTVYWGNNGLAAGNVSTAGGTENTVDTVECVLLTSPQSGVWTVQVIGSDINTDARLETPGINADYALVVVGATHSAKMTSAVLDQGRTFSGTVANTAYSDGVAWVIDGQDLINESVANAQFETQFDVPGGASLSALNLRFDTSTQETNSRMLVYLYNGVNDALELVGSVNLTTADQCIEIKPTGNLNRFIDAGKIKMRMVAYRTNGGLDLHWRLDQVRADMHP